MRTGRQHLQSHGPDPVGNLGKQHRQPSVDGYDHDPTAHEAVCRLHVSLRQAAYRRRLEQTRPRPYDGRGLQAAAGKRVDHGVIPDEQSAA